MQIGGSFSHLMKPLAVNKIHMFNDVDRYLDQPSVFSLPACVALQFREGLCMPRGHFCPPRGKKEGEPHQLSLSPFIRKKSFLKILPTYVSQGPMVRPKCNRD